VSHLFLFYITFGHVMLSKNQVHGFFLSISFLAMLVGWWTALLGLVGVFCVYRGILPS